MATARAVALRAVAHARRGIAAAAGNFRAIDSQRQRERLILPSGSGDYRADTRSRERLRDLSRDLEANAEAYQILLKRTASLIGAPTPRPTTSDPDWNAAVVRRWQAWAGSTFGGPDDRGLSTWGALCALWWRAWLRDGDVALVLLDEGTIATYESDQIAGGGSGNQHRRNCGGVTLDAAGRPVAFWIAPRRGGGASVDAAAAVPVPADQVRFLACRWYTSQTRGVPLLTPGLDNVERGDGLVESEVISAEQASNLYGAIERAQDTGGTFSGGPALGTGAAPVTTYVGGDGRSYPSTLEWSAGTYLDMPTGTKWNAIPATRPNMNVPEFLRQMLMQACAVLELPYPVVFADFRDCSWSVNRGLVSLARDGLKNLRDLHCQPFLAAVYPWWLEREIRAGRIPAPKVRDETYSHAWDWPVTPEWPDPYKEEQTRDLSLQQETSSLHRILGPEWASIHRERMQELAVGDRDYVARYVAAAQMIADAKKAHPGLVLNLLPEHVLNRDASPNTVSTIPIMPDAAAPAVPAEELTP